MSDTTPQLLDRAQSAPLFILSFRYRDELALMASHAGWQSIAARRGAGAEQRFLSSGAIIAVVDMRGAVKEALEAITQLTEAAEANGAALLVIGARGHTASLDQALSAGATHVVSAPLTDARFALALRSAERHALRMLANGYKRTPHHDIWRDQQLSWQRQGQSIHLSPALSARMRLDTTVIRYDKWLDLMPRDGRAAFIDTVDHVLNDGRPRALSHQLSTTDVHPIAHHLRIDPVKQELQGLIELSLADTNATSTRLRDPLTGLRSIAGARQWLTLHITPPQIMLMIGLTQYKMINSAFGRLTGDSVLRAISRRIERIVEQMCPPDTLIARVSGTGFVITLIGKTAVSRAAILVSEITNVIERPVIAEGHEVSIGCCIAGVERHAGENGANLLRRASEALSEARAPGGNRIHLLAAQESIAIQAGNALQTDLRNALDRNEIDILFQPQVDISSGVIVGVEALARWQHPAHGTLGAETLFAVAERSDYLNALSAHIQKRALECAAAWPPALAHLRLAINLTAQDIARAGFAQTFLAMLDATGFPRTRLTVEITESGLIDDLGRAADLFAELRQGGCRVAIDDFGTGYSSLAYLKALPLDYLKIDKALAQDIVGTARDRVVVRGVIDMARSLGLAVVAEGVETEEQLTALAAQGCNYYQGFLCAEPLDVAALKALLLG